MTLREIRRAPDGEGRISEPRISEPRISIVVISYRRPGEIERCLDDLAAQRTRVVFEVVLLLQAYPEGVAERLTATFASAFPLHVYHAEHALGVHGARNAALARTSGDIVAFLDDDVRVPPNWLESMAPYYDDPSVGGVGGFVRHPGSQRVITRVLRPVLGLSARRYRIDWGGFHAIPWSSHPSRDQDADWLSGCNMSFRRSALEQVGGFDEGYGRYGYDDVDVGLRVRQAGWRLISTRRLSVTHNPSSINRAALPDLICEEEERRVRLVRRAIGNRRAWRVRYLARFAYHLIALSLQGIARGCPSLPFRAVDGARRGLALYGRGGTT
jgi:GT2 family glycosyltransferase